MTTIYYNFPLLSVSLQGANSSQEIHIPKSTQPTTNIQIDNANYMAYSILITTDSASNLPNYLVVKCLADINDTTSKMVYIAIPITVLPDGNTNKTDLDNIIEPNGASMVNMTLNNYIKDGKDCVKSTDNNIITVTLDKDSGITINKYVGKTYYAQSKLSGFKPNQDIKGNKNAKVAKKELDWVMDCELLTEDGKKTEVIDLGSAAMTISLSMMTILIAGVVYLWGPIIYEISGIRSKIDTLSGNEDLKGNHYAVNRFIGINLSIIAFMLFFYGFSNKDGQMYLFASFSLLLSYFAGTTGVLTKDGISNADHTGFDKTDKMFAFYSSITRWYILPDIFKMSGIVFAIMVFVLVLAIPGSFATENDGFILFNVVICIALIFTTVIALFKFDAPKTL
jgi:hypothetical protein